MGELLRAGATRVEALVWLCREQHIGFDAAFEAYSSEIGSTREALRARLDPQALRALELAEVSITHAEHEPLPRDGVWAEFAYVDFWDVPRFIGFVREYWLVTLDAPFREDQDEYDDHYEIRVLDIVARQPTEQGLLRTGDEARSDARSLGRIPVKEVRFDASRRRAIELRASGLEATLDGLVR